MKVPMVLIVDDEPFLRLPMRNALQAEGFQVHEVDDGLAALTFLRNYPCDLIISDVMMPGMDGFTLCRILRNQEFTRDIPIVITTSLEDVDSIELAYQIGVADFITKPVNWHLLGYRIRYVLRASNTAKAFVSQEWELLCARLEIIRRLGRAVEYRDNESGAHVQRMSHYAALLGKQVGLSEEEQQLLLEASALHDVGKIGIPDSILLKPGKLTEQEFAVMKTHTVLGGELLDRDPSLLMRTCHDIALTHHERWDGHGYPRGLAGTEIPLLGRISTLADVFDALTSKRPYKEPWCVEDAVNEICNQSGTIFDPSLVEAFVAVLPEIRAIKESFPDH
ncbi:MAG: response regulator [Magnetococcales bacterium]|nr:response regulator [Magnetococcales bacterium]MBF0117119.1 response regulator [Magnetococcales bacterium]